MTKRLASNRTKRVKYGDKKGAYKTIRKHRYKYVGASSNEAAGNMKANLETRYSVVKQIKDKTGVSFWGRK